MGRHSLGRSPGDLGSAPAAGGEATSRARGLSGAGMGLPRRTRPSVKDRPAAVADTAATDGGSDRRSGQAASAAAFPTASGVRGGGEDRGGDVVIGSVVSAMLAT